MVKKRKDIRPCLIDGCDCPHYGRGWCSLHYQKWLNHGSPTYFYQRMTGPGTVCEGPDCQREVACAGLCTMHYQRMQRWGKDDPKFINPHTVTEPMYCEIEGCEKRVIARNLCTMHYQRWAAHGNPLTCFNPKAETPQEYLEMRHVKTDGCWLWTGSTDISDGYGKCNVKQWGKELAALGVRSGRGRTFRAHRLAYAIWVKPIPRGTVIHHTCHNRPCVNPDHLQAVTPKENTAEMVERQALLKEIADLKKQITKQTGADDG